MPDVDLDQLLCRPVVVAAVRDLGVDSLAIEDVLAALRRFGRVRIELDNDRERPYLCLLEAGDEREYGRGRTVLHAALACWAEALEDFGRYTEHGIAELERFLLDPDVA
jgi:hypothetical protein